MKREYTVSITVTGDEKETLRQLRREYEDKENIIITQSEYLRQFLLMPYLAANEIRSDSKEDPPTPPPSKIDSEQESEQPNKNMFSFDKI